MSLTVRSPAGESVSLSDTPFAQGGEAVVYAVPRFPGAVVKLYHPQVLEKRRDSLRAKIDAMAGAPELSRFRQRAGLAWPKFSVFDEGGQWRGYAMSKADGKRMNVLAHFKAYGEHFPGLDRPELVRYMLSLLGSIEALHQTGVMIGDYNPANFLCEPTSGTVTLIDSDSWQFTTTGKIFRCPVAAPDMLAPELQGKELGKINRTLESEHFSLAILLFKMLMLGRHPYDVIGGTGPVENIGKGHFPYGLGGGGIPKGVWFNIWSHLPYKLKEQFVRTFREGARHPAERTSTGEWIVLLKLYQREMARGWHDTQLKPAAPKAKDYRGSQSISQPIGG